MGIRFADWVLDGGRRELVRHGQGVALTPKAFELLRLLLERRPNAVAKAEIYDQLWPATFVAEVNLARLVFEIRSVRITVRVIPPEESTETGGSEDRR